MDSSEKSASIRRMRSEDAEDISKIYGIITKELLQADFKQSIQELADKSDSVCFVAERDNQVVGFMISYILTLGFGMEKSAWVATMGVHPKCMGQGIGTKMAREILSFYKSKGINRVYTSVRWDSTDLLSFFKILGFDRSSFINLMKDIE